MSQPLNLGGVRVDPPTVLAPMAGTTLRPFRRLCRDLGAGLVCGEMISGMALRYANRKTARMLALDPLERPVSFQIAAGSPDVAAEAVGDILPTGADLIDINMGCPVPKVRKSGAGAILMTDPCLAREIMDAAVEAAGTTPVTVKMRAGWDDDRINFMEIAEAAVEAGCVAVALHARTAEQMYSGRAHWPWIAELVRGVPVPVIGNGDVRSHDDCLRMMEETGCAAVMIGRVTQGDPWVFQRCAAALSDEPIPDPPNWEERLATAQRMCEDLVEELGEHTGCLHARRVLGWFSKGMADAARFRDRAHQVSTLDEVRDLVGSYSRELAE